MKLPSELIQKIQGDYVASKYKDGVFTFANIDEKTLEVFIGGLLEWAEAHELIDSENRMDISQLKEW